MMWYWTHWGDNLVTSYIGSRFLQLKGMLIYHVLQTTWDSRNSLSFRPARGGGRGLPDAHRSHERTAFRLNGAGFGLEKWGARKSEGIVYLSSTITRQTKFLPSPSPSLSSIWPSDPIRCEQAGDTLRSFRLCFCVWLVACTCLYDKRYWAFHV